MLFIFIFRCYYILTLLAGPDSIRFNPTQFESFCRRFDRISRYDAADRNRVSLALLRPRHSHNIRRLARSLTDRAHENDAGEQGTAERRQIQSRRQP